MPKRLFTRRSLLGRNPRRPVRPGLRPGIFLLIFTLLLSSFIFWADSKVRPLVSQLAVAKVHILASQMVNDAVTDYIAVQGLQYSDLIHFEKDWEGNIAALKTDMSRVNTLKSNVIHNVNTRLTAMKTTEIRIPLGNVVSGELLAGRGPGIPIRLVPYGVVNAAFQNSFTSAGINQTRHQIMMDITVDIGVLLPGSTTETAVTVQVSVAETVIVGRVPDSYVNFNDGEIF